MVAGRPRALGAVPGRVGRSVPFPDTWRCSPEREWHAVEYSRTLLRQTLTEMERGVKTINIGRNRTTEVVGRVSPIRAARRGAGERACDVQAQQ